jgi:hypothetical protein
MALKVGDSLFPDSKRKETIIVCTAAFHYCTVTVFYFVFFAPLRWPTVPLSDRLVRLPVICTTASRRRSLVIFAKRVSLW